MSRTLFAFVLYDVQTADLLTSLARLGSEILSQPEPIIFKFLQEDVSDSANIVIG